jgi:aminopeptidase N
MRQFRPASFLLSIILLLSLAPVLADTNAANDDPAELLRNLQIHRILEADIKEQAARKWFTTPSNKTANMARYDVHHYHLDLNLNPATEVLNGVMTMSAHVVDTDLGRVELHLDNNMSVLAVSSGGTAATHTHSGGILAINLDRTYISGESFTVAVTYSGNPEGGAFGWSSHSGKDMIWTLSEPYGAREWWPCKDLNTDKADSLDVIVSVPDNLVVASQGLLVSETSDGSTRTYHWQSGYPINTYLVSLAIHPYTRYSDWYTPQAGGDPMEIQYFVYPENYPGGTGDYYLTPDMIDVFAQVYGEYPFIDEKYGHADFVWGGGMEHQTISSMGFYFEDLITHELAHQWWGDMVTCADFGHIWLNEGFATWSEALWAEHRYGFETYKAYMAGAAYYGAGTIFVEDPYTQNIFSSDLSYNKASWVVHMLRGILGDEDFYAGLALYRGNHEYGSATTADLQAALESISGRDLEAFFQQWIYGEYFPIYEMGWTNGPGAGEITVDIDQVQTNTGVFTMPVPLSITTDLGTEVVKVENDQASQSFVIPVSGTVQSVELDPDRWILRQVREIVSSPSLAEGVLLVNGVSWNTYGSEITDAYNARAFWGDTPIQFWDNFAEPAGGYPATLPAPLGHGRVPASVIGRFSTVIWVGNNYGGDLPMWTESPILSYLEAGGNVLLMTRRAGDFLEGDLQDYLGLTLSADDRTLNNCVAGPASLEDIAFIGAQSYNDVFSTIVGTETTILFRETVSFGGPRVTGAVAIPAGGGTSRPDGGRFALISGRPYRMDATDLQTNVETILADYLLEPYTPPVTAVGDEIPAAETRLGQNFPNPFNPRTVIPFSLEKAGRVDLDIFDARGRLVVHLLEGEYPAGSHTVAWTAQDEGGRALPSGVYFARMRNDNGATRTSRMVLVR